MFIILPEVVGNWRKSKGPSLGEWASKLWQMRTMEYCVANRKKTQRTAQSHDRL